MVVFVMIFQRRVGHFKPGFLSSQGSKLDNLSAHKIENFLNFSKLTQLLSVGQFLRPLGAFKTEKPNRRIYFSGLVCLGTIYLRLPRFEPIPLTLPRPRLPLHHKPAIAKMLNRSQVYLEMFSLEH